MHYLSSLLKGEGIQRAFVFARCRLLVEEALLVIEHFACFVQIESTINRYVAHFHTIGATPSRVNGHSHESCLAVAAPYVVRFWSEAIGPPLALWLVAMGVSVFASVE